MNTYKIQTGLTYAGECEIVSVARYFGDSKRKTWIFKVQLRWPGREVKESF